MKEIVLFLNVLTFNLKADFNQNYFELKLELIKGTYFIEKSNLSQVGSKCDTLQSKC